MIDWRQRNATFFNALQVERNVMFLILTLIILVAAVVLFALRAVVNGVAQGGGTLAWNLGHLHFASSGNADVYMGIHVFLAGVRGLIAPLAGMWLYTCIGSWIWLVAIVMSLSSLSIYHDLAEEGEQLAV